VNDGALALGKHLKLVYMHYIFVGICTPRTEWGAFMDFSLLAHEYWSNYANMSTGNSLSKFIPSSLWLCMS
jgi:hypothetical protein